jgi:hypothetical protein
MAGRHQRLPEEALPADADLRLRAIADNQPVIVEGIVAFPGAPSSYLYRTTYQPSGTVEGQLLRLAPGPLPPPDISPSK